MQLGQVQYTGDVTKILTIINGLGTQTEIPNSGLGSGNGVCKLVDTKTKIIEWDQEKM